LAEGLLGLGDLDRGEVIIDEALSLTVTGEEKKKVNEKRAKLLFLRVQQPIAVIDSLMDTTEVASEMNEKEISEPLITNSFFETDLRQVLIDLSMETSIPILWDETVQGMVTYEAIDQPLETVLRAVLFPAGYTFSYEDGTYYVGSIRPEDPAFGMLSKTDIVILSNIEASKAIGLLSNHFQPYVKAYDTSNMVCITAPPTLIHRIRDDLIMIDIPQSQIMIEVIVTEISSEALREMGLDWSLSGTDENPVWDVIIDNTDIENPGLLGNYTDLSVDIGDYTVDLITSLEALVQSGQAKIRANPRITTLNGRTAEISLTTDQYFIIQTSTSQTYQYNTLEAVSSGIKLEITPYISTSKEITIYLQPEVGDVVGRGTNDLPEISTRSANTSVRVMDGETFSIGGLSLQQEKNVQKKFPFLGDIPILGYVFRYDLKEVRDTEIIIFVTPHILEG
jgi:type IV pilus assembly protein PilQ